ncbi:hypothetical protein LINPERPRIM_LOCUS37981 [Linum perenne]
MTSSAKVTQSPLNLSRPFMSPRSGSLSSPLTAPPANGATKG